MTKHMKKILFALFATCLLEGCGIYNKYKQPDLTATTDSLFREELAADTASSLAELSWKELFADPQLQDLISQALRTNTDLRIARLTLIADRYDEIQSVISLYHALGGGNS